VYGSLAYIISSGLAHALVDVEIRRNYFFGKGKEIWRRRAGEEQQEVAKEEGREIEGAEEITRKSAGN
jgi:hypothetical protein